MADDCRPAEPCGPWSPGAGRDYVCKTCGRSSQFAHRYHVFCARPDQLEARIEQRLASGEDAAVVLERLDNDLVDRFSPALKEKLAQARAKGRSGWHCRGWAEECRKRLIEHLAKGDPRDVAALAAFLWHHHEPTALPDGYYAAGRRLPEIDELIEAATALETAHIELAGTRYLARKPVSDLSNLENGRRYRIAQLIGVLHRARAAMDRAGRRDDTPAPTVRIGETRPCIYVASRASVPERGAMWRKLRDAGAPIISSWIDEDGPGQTQDFGELWTRIAREVTSADGLILYVEPDDFPLKGALVEVGMALAVERPVYVVAPAVKLETRSLRPLGSWASHPLVHFAPTVADAINAITAAAAITDTEAWR